jgi:hypothetical protein
MQAGIKTAGGTKMTKMTLSKPINSTARKKSFLKRADEKRLPMLNPRSSSRAPEARGDPEK